MNEEAASRIAEFIRARGFFGSIVVRREKVVGDFGEREDARMLLVAGRNRLRAAELLGLKEIPAIFFKGDHRHARLITIEENLFRKDLTALERAEHYAAWFRISKRLEDSGQDVRKRKAGRPEGGLSKLARDLPISGKTVEARRKRSSGQARSPAFIRKRKKLSRRRNFITIKRRCLRSPRRGHGMTKPKRCENCGRPGIRGGLPSKSDFEKRCQLRRGEFIRTCWPHGTRRQYLGKLGIGPPGNWGNASSTRCCEGRAAIPLKKQSI